MRSWDVLIIKGKREVPLVYGPQGGVQIGGALREPSNVRAVDSIIIESLHHGAGRLLSTDMQAYRGVPAGVSAGAFGGAPGYILPGGRSAQLAYFSAPSVREGLFGAAFYHGGYFHFAIGNSLYRLDPGTESVTLVRTLSAGRFYTGSWVEWGTKVWLGVEDTAGTAVMAQSLDGQELTASEYVFSWAASTRNAIYWVANRAGGTPTLRWSDDTANEFGSLNTTLVYGPWNLEIPARRVSGMTAHGPFALFTSPHGDIWGLDPQEVFAPLSASIDVSGDPYWGGQMPQLLGSVLVPARRGPHAFTTGNLRLTDISPSVLQGAYPTFTSGPPECTAIASAGTWAVAAMRFGGHKPGLHALYTYRDGSYWHILLPDAGVERVWALVISPRLGRLYYAGTVTSAGGELILFHRLDIPGPGWQPRPDRLADVSALETVRYMGRPPQALKRAIQVRGHANITRGARIDVDIEVEGRWYSVGHIGSSGAFVLPVPPSVPPGRTMALRFTFRVVDDTEVPWIALPVAIDYTYTPAAVGGDSIVAAVTVSTDTVHRLGGLWRQSVQELVDWLVALRGSVVTMAIAPSAEPWSVLIEDVRAEQMTTNAGPSPDTYLVRILARKL